MDYFDSRESNSHNSSNKQRIGGGGMVSKPPRTRKDDRPDKQETLPTSLQTGFIAKTS